MALSLLGVVCLSSCSSQPIPTHGGGKRFFFEQYLVARSADESVRQLRLAELDELYPTTDPNSPIFNPNASESGYVRVWVVAMADEGSGVGGEGQSSREFVLGSDPDATYAADRSETSRDLKYLETRVCQKLEEMGVPTHLSRGGATAPSGDLFILVSEFGTAKSGFTILIYNERKLRARTALEAFYISREQEGLYLHLGHGDTTTSMYEEFFLGAGPINTPEETFNIVYGPIPGTEEGLNDE